MSKKGIKTAEYDGAHLWRDAVIGDLQDLLPDLRPEAVTIGVVTCNAGLELSANVIGNTEPYSPEDVCYILGELGVSSTNL